MKPANLVLLALILIIGIVNLLVAFGIIGGPGGGGAAGGSYDYRVVDAQEMDSIGFKAVAADEGLVADEQGQIQFPREKVVKPILLSRTLKEVEKEGWEFVSVTSDHHYIFRKPK